MSSAYDAAQWAEFGVAVVGATAALAGLLFVAVSINIERILRFPTLPRMAATTLILFGTALFAGILLLVPGQTHRALGTELLLLGILAALVTLPSQLVRRGPATRRRRVWAWVLTRPTPVVLTSLSLVAGRRRLQLPGPGRSVLARRHRARGDLRRPRERVGAAGRDPALSDARELVDGGASRVGTGDHGAVVSVSVPSSLLRPVRDGNAFETAVERLVRTIKLGVIADGERLPPERDLAAALQVGRTTLAGGARGAAPGRLRRDPARARRRHVRHLRRDAGAPATPSRSPGRWAQRLHDALDFRRVVEPGAAALAASRELSAADRTALQAALEACGSAPDDRARRGADSRLHLMIAGMAGSDLLLAAVVDVQLRVGELLAAIPVLRRNIAHSDAQHAEIVEAILAGDPAHARRAMEEHCDGTSALLRGFLT